MAAAGDEPLVAAARAGDAAAFNRLVLRHQDAVYTLCFRLTGNADDAADVAQETFLLAYRHLEDFRGGAFRSWLLRIAANSCYDLHRQRRRHPTAPLDPVDEDGAVPSHEPLDPSAGPETALLRDEFAGVIQALLLQLSPDQRIAIVLCDLYDFDYQSIASATGVELGTVKSRINRGRRRLRDLLLANRELLPAQYRLSDESEPRSRSRVPAQRGTRNSERGSPEA